MENFNEILDITNTKLLIIQSTYKLGKRNKSIHANIHTVNYDKKYKKYGTVIQCDMKQGSFLVQNSFFQILIEFIIS